MLSPRSAAAYAARGDSFSLLGDHQRAVRNYSFALDLEPSLNFLELRAAAYQQSGEFGKAIEDWSRAIGMDPGRAAAYLKRASCYRTAGQLQEALKYLDKAIEIAPQDGAAYHERADVKSALGDRAGAKADRGKAADLEYY